LEFIKDQSIGKISFLKKLFIFIDSVSIISFLLSLYSWINGFPYPGAIFVLIFMPAINLGLNVIMIISGFIMEHYAKNKFNDKSLLLISRRTYVLGALIILFSIISFIVIVFASLNQING
jgi:hypothetical protein